MLHLQQRRISSASANLRSISRAEVEKLPSAAEPLPAAANRTTCRDLLAEPVETDFLFKVRRIDHRTEKQGRRFETIGPLSGP